MVLTNSQYDEIMRAYSARQFRAKNELDRRTAEVLLAIPEYKPLLDQISNLSVNAAKASLKGDSNVFATLKNDIGAIQSRLSQLLVQAHFPADYLTTQYECPLCQDTGYIGNRKCSCFKQAEINMLYNQSNLKDKLSTENFNTFSLQYYSTQQTDSATGLTPQDNARKVLGICRDFVKTFPAGRNLL